MVNLALDYSPMRFSSQVGQGFLRRFNVGLARTVGISDNGWFIRKDWLMFGKLVGIGYGWKTAGENNVLLQVNLAGRQALENSYYFLNVSLGYLF